MLVFLLNRIVQIYFKYKLFAPKILKTQKTILAKKDEQNNNLGS